MLFGNKDDFAIECYKDNPHNWSGKHLYGRMCLWCGGRRLGDINDVNILGVIESQFSNLLPELPKLTNELLETLPGPAAFEFLDSRLFLDSGQSDEQISTDSKRFSKYVFLTNWAENFDGIKAFITKAEGGYRILYRDHRDRDGSFAAAHVSQQAVEQAITGFLNWVSQEKPR